MQLPVNINTYLTREQTSVEQDFIRGVGMAIFFQATKQDVLGFLFIIMLFVWACVDLRPGWMKHLKYFTTTRALALVKTRSYSKCLKPLRFLSSCDITLHTICTFKPNLHLVLRLSVSGYVIWIITSNHRLLHLHLALIISILST